MSLDAILDAFSNYFPSLIVFAAHSGTWQYSTKTTEQATAQKAASNRIRRRRAPTIITSLCDWKSIAGCRCQFAD